MRSIVAVMRTPRMAERVVWQQAAGTQPGTRLETASDPTGRGPLRASARAKAGSSPVLLATRLCLEVPRTPPGFGSVSSGNQLNWFSQLNSENSGSLV